jgi:hypothetical protein
MLIALLMMATFFLGKLRASVTSLGVGARPSSSFNFALARRHFVTSSTM